jgi:tRNA1(Val) A37 N6-methylase TrmN6
MDVTDDMLLDGRLRLRQPRVGYRAGMDAALLAAACDASIGARVLEAGCGVGAVMLSAAVRRPGATFVGIENDPLTLDLAHANIAANLMSDKVVAIEGDITHSFAALGLPPFDAALANPPFFDDASALRGPGPGKQRAWIAEGGLSAWAGFLTKSVREGGTITIIHRADRLGDILAAFSPKTGAIQIRPIQSFADTPAKRVVVRVVKSAKAPMRLLPPIVMHCRGGPKHEQVAERILRGEAALDWL